MIITKSHSKLEKLEVQAFKDRARGGGPYSSFKVMFNPETYSLEYGSNFQKQQGINTTSREARFSHNRPKKLSLNLVFDDSGVSEFGGMERPGNKDNVPKQVKEFLKLTVVMEGSIHEPKYLKVKWGDLSFDCRLESANVKYTMFDRSGNPIRAELDVAFIEDIDEEKRVKKENKTSSDLTHVRTVKSEDTLPLMAKTVYGDPAYYIQLAWANKLNNFRRLKVGEAINFPPVRK